MWPQEERWRRLVLRLHFWHLFICWILMFDLILALRIALNINYMNEVIKGFFVLSTCIAYTLKVGYFKMNNVALLQLFRNLHDAHFRPEDAHESRLLQEASELSRTIRNYYGGISVAALTIILLTQIAIDKTELPLATYAPFDDTHGTWGFGVTYGYQCIALSLACFLNISFDSLCCSIFIFIKCQLDILALRLQRIGLQDVDERQTQQQLKQCIGFYMKIVELAGDIEKLVYKPISAQIFCSVLVLTANFYAMSLLSDEKLVFLKFFIYQNCMLSQVFILCYYAGEVTQRSSELAHELYKCHWVGWPRANQRMLLMLMQRLGTPIRIRTLNASHSFDLALFSSVSTWFFLAVYTANERLIRAHYLRAAIKAPKLRHNSKSKSGVIMLLQEYTQSFYYYQVWYFQLLGAWQAPRDSNRWQRCLHELRFYLILTIVSVMLLFFAIRVLGNMDQLSIILQVFFMFATEVSCLIKLLSIRWRREQQARLIDEMHCEHFRPCDVSESLRYQSTARLAMKLRNYYGVMSLLAAGPILVTPWLVGNSALPLSMYEPCDLASSTGCYCGLYLYHVLSLIPTCGLNIAFDSFVQSLLYFLRVQLDMLTDRLENLGAVLTPQDDALIAKQLRESCAYYNRIVKLRDLMGDFIKVPCSTQLLCSVLVLVSNFYEISINSGQTAIVIKTAMYQLVMLMQIFIICYAADDMTHQSSLLCHALYKSNWTSWNKANRKMCLLMMLRFNEPLFMHTLNHTQTFSLTTFASIVNCSYSYFALLKRVNS